MNHNLTIATCLCILTMCLPATAQEVKPWHQFGHAKLVLHRGLIAHHIFNPGMSGASEWTNYFSTSFSYPQGRSLKVYSGGQIREGWSKKNSAAGEGIWILSKTNGTPHVSAAGGLVITPDVEGVEHDPSTYPEAYLGVVHDEDYALSYRRNNGREVPQVASINLRNIQTNWWPARGEINAARTPIGKNSPVMIWNFRFGRYNKGQSFTDRIASGEFQQMSAPSWAESLSDDDFPEVVGISRGRSKDTELQWSRKWYQWGHADYDDFLIVENTIENASNTRAEDVYMAFRVRFWQQTTNSWRNESAWSHRPYDWARDDHVRSTLASNYLEGVSRDAYLSGAGKPAGLQLGKDLADKGHPMLYHHDGESDHFTNFHPDVGDPFRWELSKERYQREQTWIPKGFVQQGQYFGLGVVDAMPPFNTYGGLDSDIYISPHDNLSTTQNEAQQQPATTTTWRYIDINNFTNPTPFVDTPTEVYNDLTTAGHHDEPHEAFAYVQIITFGPYTLEPGEKAKVVLAYVGGMAADDPRYSDYRRYSKPFNFAWMDLSNGTGHNQVTFEQRQREIPLGEDALFRHFQRAIDVYNWGYDIPNQPPNVKLSWTSDPNANTRLSWSAFGEDSADPDYTGSEAQDLRGYRIYRSTSENQGPWEFTAEFSFEDARLGNLPSTITYDPSGVFHTNPNSAFPEGIPLTENPFVGGQDANAGAQIPGLYTFTDRQSKAGFSNFYSVRLYDSGHNDWKSTGQSISVLESSPGPAAGATVGGTKGIIPFVPGTALFDNLNTPVRVVPNPWKADDDLHTYNRQPDIRFTNLPGRCQIDLYDVTGHRIWTFFHDNLNRGEVTWQQITENRPTVDNLAGESMSPGIYFWKVTSLMPSSEGKVQKGTFVIIK